MNKKQIFVFMNLYDLGMGFFIVAQLSLNGLILWGSIILPVIRGELGMADGSL